MGFSLLALDVEGEKKKKKHNRNKRQMIWSSDYLRKGGPPVLKTFLRLRIFKLCIYQSTSEHSLESMEFASNRIGTLKLPVDRVAYLHEDSLQSPGEGCCYLLPECRWLSMSLTEIVCVSDF